MLKKTYGKKKKNCRVTFTVPASIHAERIHVCGEFNEWNKTSHPLTHRKDGRFSATLALDTGRSYQFRYLLDGDRWMNDKQADAYAPNSFGGENSIIEL